MRVEQRSLVALAALVLLPACDCVRTADGVVSDATTGTPLAGVKCAVVGKSESVATDAAGHYQVSTGLRGTGFSTSCGDIDVEFSTSGYKSITVKNPGNVSMEHL